MRKLSVAIAVYNEEKNIERCLASIQSIADEIIVVDGGSTDNTVKIAKSFTQHVVVTKNPTNFHINKQMALDACHEEWILQLDADEEVSQRLRDEIFGVIRMNDSERELYTIDSHKIQLFIRHKKNVDRRDGVRPVTEGSIVAYYIPRRNFFLGKPMTYAGMYPDGVIRLFKRGKARFPVISVHEQLDVDGRIGFLQNDLLHYSNSDLKRYILGAQRYTNLLVEEIKNQKSADIIVFFRYCFIKPAVTFFSLFIRHKGILDGIHGFLFCFFSSLHFPVAFWKYAHRL